MLSRVQGPGVGGQTPRGRGREAQQPGQGRWLQLGACAPALAAFFGLRECAASRVPMAGTERTRRWAEPVVPSERPLQPEHLQVDPGATGHPQRLEGPRYSVQSPCWGAASPCQDPDVTMRSKPCFCHDRAPAQDHIWVPASGDPGRWLTD